jgi:hypothetical protein
MNLDVPAKTVSEQHLNNKERAQDSAEADHLCRRREAGKTKLHDLCLQNGILFMFIFPSPNLFDKASILLCNFQHHTEEDNISVANTKFDNAVNTPEAALSMVMALDGDKTISSCDSGTLLWGMVFQEKRRSEEKPERPLKEIFSSSLGYSYPAFLWAV